MLIGVIGFIEAKHKKKRFAFLLAVRPLAVVCGAEFESCHFDQISTVIMIRSRIVKAVLVFYSKALIYKAFSCFYELVECPYQNYKDSFY